MCSIFWATVPKAHPVAWRCATINDQNSGLAVGLPASDGALTRLKSACGIDSIGMLNARGFVRSSIAARTGCIFKCGNSKCWRRGLVRRRGVQTVRCRRPVDGRRGLRARQGIAVEGCGLGNTRAHLAKRLAAIYSELERGIDVVHTAHMKGVELRQMRQ